MNISTKQALKNYYVDLRYMVNLGGRECVNENSCGTPEFASDEEMHAYIDAIARLATEATKAEFRTNN